MSWREPLWLLVSLFPLFLWLWQILSQRQQSQRYADSALLPWVQGGNTHWRNNIRPVLWSLFWVLIAVSLAGPRLPLAQNNTQAPDKKIMLLIDVSRSMHTQDILPSRLERAGLELYEFLQIAKATNSSRIGIIVYAARPHLLVPPTSDMNALKFYLEKLDTLVLPTRGSEPAAALKMASSILGDKSQALPSLVLWLTDGDFPASQLTAIKTQLDQLKQANQPLYILGIGTEDGEAIPLGKGKWLAYQGKTVRSKLNSAVLQQLAEAGKGRYSSVKDDESDWQTLYQKGIQKAFPSKIRDQKQQWQELFMWALFPAVFVLFLLVALPRNVLVSVILLGFVISLSIPSSSFAADKTSALQAGIHAYRTQQFDQAIKHFSRAVFDAETDTQRARALYNLGNSYFQQGDYVAATQVFEDSLTYRKNHSSTKQNLALAKTVQAALEQKLALLRRQQLLSEGQNKLDGNRLEAIGNDLNWDQDSTKTSGKSNNKPATGLPTLPIDQASLKQLVSKGLKRLQQEGASSIHEKIRRQQSLGEAQIALQEMDDNPAIFWKRLFEIEEGFPGSLKKPKQIPGVQPW